ncbi:hypothetical protein HGRIS_012647 [Hohenbuehelia grisea]|uniref:DUF6593 domain-containing protein n=1 Tax=Hohenbuehelia grisea TaxID=104357 RepID=A0ABR3IT33_9AGAR
METLRYSSASSGSQTTFTNTSPPTTIVWDQNSMTNATLYVGGHATYQVRTASKGTRTILQDSFGETAARIDLRSILPDLVLLPRSTRGKSIRLRKWLYDTKNRAAQYPGDVDIRYEPRRRLSTLMQSSKGTYLWMATPTHRLALYDSSCLESPIASFIPSTSRSKPAIVIAPDVEVDQVEIVLAVLVLEQRLRLQEKQLLVASGVDQLARYAFAGHAQE